MHPPRSRAWPVALGIAAAVICALLYFAARATVFDPTLLPGHDGSGYIQRGLHIRDALVERDFSALFDHIFRPDIRPPAFPVLLGLYQLVRGDDLAVAIEWSAVAFFLSLAALVALGHALEPRRGWIAGIAAAVLTAMGLDHLAMTLFPMSETTTLLMTIVVTLGVVRLVSRPGWAPALGIGGFLLLGALVRYNLPVPLLAALLADHVWTHRRSPAAIASPRVLLWIAPVVVVFGVWQVAQPNLFDNVQKFLVNRSSGLEFWSAENLLFVPRTALSDYLGQAWLGGILLVAFVAGLAPAVLDGERHGETGPVQWQFPAGRPLRVVQLSVLASVAALTLHDYKIDRNLYALLPLGYLCALVPFVGITLRGSRLIPGSVLAVILGIAVTVQAGTRFPALSERYHFEGDPAVGLALDFIEKNAGGTQRLWITGANDGLSPPLIELWLRKAGKDSVEVRTNADPMTERTRTGIDPTWSEKYTEAVATKFLTEKELARTTWITIETIPGSRRFKSGQKWTNFQNNYARAFAEQTIVPEVDRLLLGDSGYALRAYRPGGTALAADATAPAPIPESTRPAPESYVGGPDGYSESFEESLGGWRLLPENTAPPDTLGRADGKAIVRVNPPLPKLQLCSPIIRTSRTFTVTVEGDASAATGRVVALQLRGLTEADAFNKVDGKGDMNRLGPFTKGTRWSRDVTLLEGSTKVRACVILDEVGGMVSIDSVTVTPK